MKLALLYMLAILAGELVTILLQPMAGIVIHIAVMVAAVLHAGLAGDLLPKTRQLVLSLALVPLVRIISLSMPLVNIPQTWWYPIIYTPLIAAAVVMVRIPGYRAADIGLKPGFAPVQLAIAATGAPLGALEYFILRPQPPNIAFGWESVLLPALFFFIFVGFGEELIFRGVLQRTATDAFGVRGIIFVSFLFAILHMGFYSWIDVLFVFVVAMFFGWAVNKTGSLLGVTLSHGLTNTMLYLIVPFFF